MFANKSSFEAPSLCEPFANRGEIGSLKTSFTPTTEEKVCAHSTRPALDFAKD